MPIKGIPSKLNWTGNVLLTIVNGKQRKDSLICKIEDFLWLCLPRHKGGKTCQLGALHTKPKMEAR